MFILGSRIRFYLNAYALVFMFILVWINLAWFHIHEALRDKSSARGPQQSMDSSRLT